MGLSRQWTLRVIDIVGGCAVAGCLLGFIWLTMIRPDRTRVQISELSRVLHQGRQDRRALRTAWEKQSAILQSHEARLSRTGQLPTNAPVEEYFQILSVLAAEQRLRVVRHKPLTPRSYPGLLEQRYTYEVTGSLPDLVLFLKAIEDADFWADVSYLSINRGRRAADSASADRLAALTISLFSAAAGEARAGKEGI